MPLRACRSARALGVVVWLVFYSGLPVSSANAQTQAVSVVTPESTPMVDRLRLSGTLSAERSARLSPRVDGLVARLRIDAGDEVRAGQPLLDQDAVLARLALDQARAVSAEARAEVDERARLLAEGRRLVDENHIPRTEVATREAAHALAQATLQARLTSERQQAELVERHVLPAPFDGVIVRRLTDAGEWVTRGTPVLELVALDRVRLDVQVPQERYEQIAADARVTVSPDANPGIAMPARIEARVPVVGETAARSFLVRVVVDDGEHRLLPGTSATAEIALIASGPAGLRIPRDALLRHPDGGFSVFVVEPGEPAAARRQPVRIGREADGYAEVLDGLQGSEQVVVRGNEMLRDGQAVRVAGH